jgi:ubiquinone/menaquinone biosynthesis C-methylase UbiE
VSALYYEQVAHAFDQAAANYDDLYQNNPIMAWMRAESLTLLKATFPPGSRLIEVGCGTGDEALAMSDSGRRVVATDLSPAMIETARHKAEASGKPDVTWHVLPAGRLADLVQCYGEPAFDGAYSSFGALNCEPQLAEVAVALGRLLRPGAWLVCSVMSRWCAWEIGWGLLHLRPRQALRRIGAGWIGAGLASPQETLSVPVQFYNPGAFATAFAPWFTLRRIRGLPVAVPPPDLGRSMAAHPVLFRRLKKLDRAARDRSPFCALGDHFVVALQRSALPGDS